METNHRGWLKAWMFMIMNSYYNLSDDGKKWIIATLYKKVVFHCFTSLLLLIRCDKHELQSPVTVIFIYMFSFFILKHTHIIKT